MAPGWVLLEKYEQRTIYDSGSQFNAKLSSVIHDRDFALASCYIRSSTDENSKSAGFGSHDRRT
jgi:hypothetical protein